MQLALKTGHIVLGHDLRMNVVLNRIILRGKTKCVPAHGIKHVISLHPPFSRHDIKGRVRTRMPYMKSLSRRIRKFHQRIVFRFGIVLRGLKGFLVVPYLLPLCLHFPVIVNFCHFVVQSFPAAYGSFFLQVYRNLRQNALSATVSSVLLILYSFYYTGGICQLFISLSAVPDHIEINQIFK